MKPGNKVKTKENHAYLGITKRHVGKVVSVDPWKHFDGLDNTIEVRFQHRAGTVLFQKAELRRVK